MMETRRNLLWLLKGRQLHNALCAVYIEVLHDLRAVLKESAPEGETA
jgi:hypothetical protein